MRHPVLRPATLAMIAARAVAALALGILSLMLLAMAVIGGHRYGMAHVDTAVTLVILAAVAAWGAARVALPQGGQL